MEIKVVAERIREIRRENKLSQTEFGEKLNVSQDTVSLWEKGKSVPSAEYLVAIAQTFGVSTDYILGLIEY